MHRLDLAATCPQVVDDIQLYYLLPLNLQDRKRQLLKTLVLALPQSYTGRAVLSTYGVGRNLNSGLLCASICTAGLCQKTTAVTRLLCPAQSAAASADA